MTCHHDLMFEVELRQKVHKRIEFVLGARLCEVAAMNENVAGHVFKTFMGIVCIGNTQDAEGI